MSDLVEVPPQRPHSGTARLIDRLIQICALVPYALVALALRAVMARLFFTTGQEIVDGPKWPVAFDYVVTVPARIRQDTLSLFDTRLSDTPLPAKLIAYVVGYADFAVPVFLILGLATRFVSLALMLLVALFDLYLEPGTFWSLHVYWYAILLVLLSCGAGAVSADYLIRRVYDR